MAKSGVFCLIYSSDTWNSLRSVLRWDKGQTLINDLCKSFWNYSDGISILQNLLLKKYKTKNIGIWRYWKLLNGNEIRSTLLEASAIITWLCFLSLLHSVVWTVYSPSSLYHSSSEPRNLATLLNWAFISLGLFILANVFLC